MTADTEATRPKRPPMDSMRKTALAAGVLYLITFVTSIPALGLYHDLLKDPAYILGNASDTGVLWGALGEIICALAGIASAVVLYRVTRRQSETAGSRIRGLSDPRGRHDLRRASSACCPS